VVRCGKLCWVSPGQPIWPFISHQVSHSVNHSPHASFPFVPEEEQNMWPHRPLRYFAASPIIPYKIHGLGLHDYLSASWYFTAVIFYHFYRTNIYLFIFQYCGLHSGPTPWATPSALFCEGIFPEIGSWWTMCLGWLQIVKLLISASWVAKIADINIVCM
jgi:hypothetical protein